MVEFAQSWRVSIPPAHLELKGLAAFSGLIAPF
jgi:hypothetical protein